MDLENDRNLSLQEVAEKLSTRDHTVKVKHVRKMCRRGELKGYKVASVWRVKESSLNKYMAGSE